MTAVIRSIESIVERMEDEIKATHNHLRSSLITRRDHLSYGVTKTALNGRYQQLVGQIEMWMIVTGIHQHSGAPVISSGVKLLIRTRLNIDLDALIGAVKEYCPGTEAACAPAPK